MIEDMLKWSKTCLNDRRHEGAIKILFNMFLIWRRSFEVIEWPPGLYLYTKSLAILWTFQQSIWFYSNCFPHLALLWFTHANYRIPCHVYYNFTKFHQNQMKNKKDLLIARFSVQNFKVSLELWKSYIVAIVRLA